MNVALWVVQLLTALAFGQHGYSLLFGLERARKRLAWTRDVETGILRFIGVQRSSARSESSFRRRRVSFPGSRFSRPAGW